MIGRIIDSRKTRMFIYVTIKNAHETIKGRLDRHVDPRPHVNDVIDCNVVYEPGEELPKISNVNILARCNAPEGVNHDVADIVTYKQKFENVVDERFKSIGALKVHTPTLVKYRGTSKIQPYETTNVKGKKLYLKFTHDLALRSIFADTLTPVYEIGNVFRNMGVSYRHATEFTMLESHIPCQTLEYGINFAVKILQDFTHFFGNSDFDNLPVKTLPESFAEFGQNFNELSNKERVDFYKQTIKKSGTFISVYQPVPAAPLASIDPKTRLALDAEIIYKGKGISHIYVCDNNYENLLQIFAEQDSDKHHIDKDFLLKAKAGIPPTVCVAIGLDRTISSMFDITVNDLIVRQRLSNER